MPGPRSSLATDFNPGTSPTPNLPLILTLGVSQLRLSVAGGGRGGHGERGRRTRIWRRRPGRSRPDTRPISRSLISRTSGSSRTGMATAGAGRPGCGAKLVTNLTYRYLKQSCRRRDTMPVVAHPECVARDSLTSWYCGARVAPATIRRTPRADVERCQAKEKGRRVRAEKAVRQSATAVHPDPGFRGQMTAMRAMSRSTTVSAICSCGRGPSAMR